MQCWVYFFGDRQMAQLKRQFLGDSSQSLRTGFLSFGRLRKAYNTGSNEFCQEFVNIDFPVAALHPVVELFIPLGRLHRRGREWSPLHHGIKRRCRLLGSKHGLCPTCGGLWARRRKQRQMWLRWRFEMMGLVLASLQVPGIENTNQLLWIDISWRNMRQNSQKQNHYITLP